MQTSFRRILTGIVFFTLTVTLAVKGYVIAGWTLLDAIYMVVITVFGVGYGEVQPLTSTSLKIFTILVIIAGALSVAYIISGFVQFIAEDELRRFLEFKRMNKDIKLLENHVIICGFGRSGQMVAKNMKAARQPFVVVDKDPDRTELAREQGYLMYLGNATDETSLRAVQIHRARTLATVLPDDAANVFITLTAREMNPNLMIVARGELPSTEKKLRLAGANHVVLPAIISGTRMAHLIQNPSTVDFLAQSDGRASLNELLAELDIQLSELLADHSLVGGTVGDIELKGKGTFIIVALQRADGEVILHPGHDLLIAQGDSVILMGHQGDMPRFAQRKARRREIGYRGMRMRF